ncbi:MAG TPA: VCBS repeat-containing protein, partial [Blastocatellia bacterium]|nr:VCBS repeat-containing protein [Blastocatellia bacterium]
MRRSLDPHASGLSLLALSLTMSLANITFLAATRVAVFAQTTCAIPSFRPLEQRIEPQNRFSNDPLAPSLAVGDLNQDSLPDVVVSPAVASEVPLLTNLGGGNFRTGYFLDLPYRDAVIADFNNDGRADIVALTVYETVTTLLGESNGSFSALNSTGGGQATVVGRYSTALRAGDFNRDGLLDVAVVNTLSNSLSILLGKGNGNFLDPVNYGVQENPHSVAVADFTGDGAPDVATANEYSETVTLLTNDGNGVFSASHFPAGALPQEVIAWDFNRDGKSDLAVLNRGYNSITVLRNEGAGNFAFATRWDLQAAGSALAAGDFNGDGQEDVAVAQPYDGAVLLLLGDGNGGFCTQS